MLIRFITSNFLSFNEEVEFNMLAGAYRTHKHHVYKTNKLKILKGSVIYGANGAGKSNLVKAINFLQELVEFGELDKSVNTKKFKLSNKNQEQPAEFEIEFSYKRKIYAYGISINRNIVEKEWLYLTGIDKEDKIIFERKKGKKGNQIITLNKKYLKTQKDRLLKELMEERLLKNNELFLGKSDSLKITDFNNVREWITQNLTLIYPNSKFASLTPIFALSESFAKFTNDLLKTFDTGLQEIDIENIDFDIFFGKDDEDFKNELIEEIDDSTFSILRHEGETLMAVNENDKYIVKRIIGIHYDSNNKKIKFELSEESDGTNRLLDFIPAFSNILVSDRTYIIDEIDQSLHPTLLNTLVKKIMDEKNTKGQLIFTTHESSLLDMNIFRQDEIWFAEKNKSGSTQLYSLSDFKPRYDLDIRKGYLKGRFGAIPFIADLKNLNWQKDDA